MTDKKFVFVCCPAITGLPVTSLVPTLSFRVWLSPASEDSTATLSLDRDHYICKSTFTFEYNTPTASNLCFHVGYPGSGIDLARLTLPLSWFPPNTVVKFQFPMKTNNHRIQTLFYAEVHRCEDRHAAFDAPQGSLTVTPAWTVQPQAPLSAMAPPPTVQIQPQIAAPTGQQWIPPFPYYAQAPMPRVQYVAPTIDPRTGQFLGWYVMPGGPPAYQPQAGTIEGMIGGDSLNDAECVPSVEAPA
jgi:hypothetical protein